MLTQLDSLPELNASSEPEPEAPAELPVDVGPQMPAALERELADADEIADQAEEFAQSGSLSAKLEALLFVAGDALPIETLARLTGAPLEEISLTLAELEAKYADCGINLRVIANGYRFATAPQVRGVVEAYLLPPKTSLSPAALETLAIVAYSQPVTKADIEAVRGVSVDGVVASLVERGLIVEVGRKETVGKPLLFGTTARFLESFGLPSLADLPALPEEQFSQLQAEVASPATLEGTIGADGVDEAALALGDAVVIESEVTSMTQTLTAPPTFAPSHDTMDPIDPVAPISPENPVQPIDPYEPMDPVEPEFDSPLQDRSSVKSEAYADDVEVNS